MSMRTIVEFNHDYAHDIGAAVDLPALLRRAMGSGAKQDWEEGLGRLGVRHVVMVHHSDDLRVQTKYTTFDLHGPIPEFDNPESKLTTALAMIADGKANALAANPLKWPSSVARIALGRNPRTNEPTETAYAARTAHIIAEERSTATFMRKIEELSPSALIWEPIEQVPKDDTVVDLWVVHRSNGLSRRVPECRFNPATGRWEDEFDDSEWEATHFMRVVGPSEPQESSS